MERRAELGVGQLRKNTGGKPCYSRSYIGPNAAPNGLPCVISMNNAGTLNKTPNSSVIVECTGQALTYCLPEYPFSPRYEVLLKPPCGQVNRHLNIYPQKTYPKQPGLIELWNT